MRRTFPVRPTRAARKWAGDPQRAVVHIPDVEVDPEYAHQALRRAVGFRSGLCGTHAARGRSHRRHLSGRAPSRGRSPTTRSRCSRPSPTRRSSPSRTCGCSTRRREALEQQTATAEILRVIASSPTDLQPVMEAVAENAARVCGATDSSIFRLEGEHLRLVARHGSLRRSLAIGDTVPVSRGTVGGRAVRDRRTIHVEDILAAEAEFPETVSRLRQARVPHPDNAGDAAAARGHAAGRHRHQSGARGPSLLGQADRAPRDVRQPGGDRHRERAAVHRNWRRGTAS